MGDVIKKFFRKKKADAKFKSAGPGHKLNEPSSSSAPPPRKDAYKPLARSGLSDESKQAAAAALARLEGKTPESTGFNTSLAAIRAQVKREMETEKNAQASADKKEEASAPKEQENPEKMAVSGVFFQCPPIGDEILSKEEWDKRIREFLYEQIPSDPGLTAVLMLHTFNYPNKEKLQVCVDTLCKYLENILQQPSEEKYRKIKKSNKAFIERVVPLEGATLVLEGAGFQSQIISQEDFYVYPEDAVSEDGLQNLEILVDALKSAEPITLELDRNMQVLMPSQAKVRKEIPRDFFRISPEELKREQQLKQEAIEKSSILMTKAMREKEELRELRNYKYSLLRIRFPDGIMLQGTFGVYEPFTEVIEFVKETLTDSEGVFSLMTPLGEKLTPSEERSLFDLRLVPTSLLMFHSDGENSLKPEILVLCQELTVPGNTT